MPKISIIIPVYNVEKYLRECLDSIVAQTLSDWECICVDDGSTDTSPDILSEYAVKDSRFIVVKGKHTNAGHCRNVGLDMAKGRYLSFLDSDDVFAPCMLEFLVVAIEEGGAEIACCEQIPYHDGDEIPTLARRSKKRDISVFETPAKTVDIYTKWCGRAWDKLFNRDFVLRENVRFQEIRSTNDMRFTYLSLALANRVVSISAALVAHRVNATSIESTRSKSPLCMMEALRSYRDEMQQRGVFDKSRQLEKHFKRFIVDFLFWYMDTIDTADACAQVYDAFSHACTEFKLGDLDASDFENKGNLYARLEYLLSGRSLMESIWLHKKQLASELYNAKCKIRGFNVLDAKVGHAVLKFPRLIKDILVK